MLLRFNKPYGVLSQFSDEQGRSTLGDYIDIPRVYAAGRLDRDSEGLLLLTDDGALQHSLAHPDSGQHKTYIVQVEGQVKEPQLQRLRHGVKLNDGMARVVSVAVLPGKPGWLWSRQPPIRVRRKIPTSWLELDLDEGRNRQVRRMTAAVGLPALRLVRSRVGAYSLGDLKPGEYHKEA